MMPFGIGLFFFAAMGYSQQKGFFGRFVGVSTADEIDLWDG